MQKSSSTTYLAEKEQALERCIILCNVIDNYGDAGVTWRLAKQLAYEHAVQVELWIDDMERARAIGAHDSSEPSIRLVAWTNTNYEQSACDSAFAGEGAQTADLVISAFACETPAPLLQAMKTKGKTGRATRWINLEYLSAEPWVESSHLLGSPKHGLTETFYFPGWFENTGGLLRERNAGQTNLENTHRGALLSLTQPDLLPKQHQQWVEASWVSLFCYVNAPVSELVQILRETNQATLVWVPQGVATKALSQLELFASQVSNSSGPDGMKTWFQLGNVVVARMPLLNQERYDDLLKVSDLNCVRGEDSLVRAVWAAKPFLWHIYPQEDQAHHAKLNAFLDRVLANWTDPEVTTLMRWWNGLSPKPKRGEPQPADLQEAFSETLNPAIYDQITHWEQSCQGLARHLTAQTDLASRLVSHFKNGATR